MRGKWVVFILILIFFGLVIQECNSSNQRNQRISTTSVDSPLKAQSGEMILAKTKSPGYYKLKDENVFELWDDGAVAEVYPTIGTYKSFSEFRKVFKGIKLYNPLKSTTSKEINGLLLFGPIHEDYNDYTGEVYNVYGLIAIVGAGFEYYENNFGKSDTFTYIQDLRLVDQKK